KPIVRDLFERVFDVLLAWMCCSLARPARCRASMPRGRYSSARERIWDNSPCRALFRERRGWGMFHVPGEGAFHPFLVTPGLDPGVHLLRKKFCEEDGLPGRARQ